MRDPTLDERLIHETTSLCAVCKQGLPARVLARGGEVWMAKRCPEHGAQEARLSDDAAWYERTRAVPAPPAPPWGPLRPVERGCPFDCGACEAHAQRARLPVVTITSACNLECPICFVHNNNASPYHMELDEVSRVIDHLAAGGEIDLINLTGGEPTLHPRLLDVLERCRAEGIHRVSICTNGIRLAQDEALVAALAAAGARVALSFDSFEEEADHRLQGAHLVALKLRCLDLLEQYDVDTTLIPVMTRGINDHEIGRILRHAILRRNVRHVEVHTITYTGQGGAGFDRSGRISLHEVLGRIESQTDGLLREDDFVASPCAHPLCYQIAYLLLDPEGGAPVPFTRFVPRETLRACLSEHLYLEPTPRLEAAMRDAIDRLWSEEDPESERTLGILKGLIARMFPADRPISREEALRISERASKAVYVHSHMDEETLDTERLAQCCDMNCYADGSQIPVCASNVLYRETEPRFTPHPVVRPPRVGGVRYLPVLG
jgi:uncharacterized radical SAM superfamily Fe-S cluster-containing enzyme